MKITIVSPEMTGPYRNGGIATFTYQLAYLLRLQAQHDVHIVYTGPMENPLHDWAHLYREVGINVIFASADRIPLHQLPGFGQNDYALRAEAAARSLPWDSDVVYLQDNGATGFQIVREGRYRAGGRPVFITVLHGSRDWVLDSQHNLYNEGYEDIALSYMERYVVRRSDFVFANSQYTLDWVRRAGWPLPSPDRVRVLKLPFVPPAKPAFAVSRAERIKKLIFFGRLETRKGIEIFVDALVSLRHFFDETQLPRPDEIVLLGRDSSNRYGSGHDICERLRNAGYHAVHIGHLDTQPAQQYLLEQAAESLVIIPSLDEALGYTAIEASLIPGIKLLISAAGGLPEVFGAASDDYTFAPTPDNLAQKLKAVLSNPPDPLPEQHRYDWHRINQGWLNAHAQACRLAQSRQTSSAIPGQPTARMAVLIYDAGPPDALRQLLYALEQQTLADFAVHIVHDGPAVQPAESVVASIAADPQTGGDLAARCQVSATGGSLGLYRSLSQALQRMDAAYVCVIATSAVLPLPGMIERMRSALHISGDDGLTCRTLIQYQSSTLVSSTYGIPMMQPPDEVFIPLGDSLEAGLLTNSFGRDVMALRREALVAALEDVLRYETPIPRNDRGYALLAALTLQGYRLDTIPEYLFSVSGAYLPTVETSAAFLDNQHVHRLYHSRLAPSGFGSVPSVVHALHMIVKFYTKTSILPERRQGTDHYFGALADDALPLFEVDNAIRNPEEEIHPADLKSPEWMARRIPYRVLLATLRRQLRRR